MPQPALKTGHLQRFRRADPLLHLLLHATRRAAGPRRPLRVCVTPWVVRGASLPPRLALRALQAYAAQELHAREWRYHTDNKLWFRRETEGGKPASAGGGAVQWVYWDVGAWSASRPVPQRRSRMASSLKTRLECVFLRNAARKAQCTCSGSSRKLESSRSALCVVPGCQ